MPSPRRVAWILSAGLLALTGCKNELDNKPAADPLEDPWVNAIDTGDEEPAVASAEPVAAGAAVAVAAEPAPTNPEASDNAAAEGEGATAEPAAGVLASPSGSPSGTPSKPSASKSASVSDKPAAAVEAEPGAEPSEPAAVEPAVVEPAAAEPAPAPAAEPAKPAEPPPITVADFHGNYRFVGGSAQRSNLEAAIEEAANQLPAVIRGVGRKRLTKTNPIDNTLDIVIAGDKVTTIFETGFDATCEIDGPTIHYTNNKGDKYKVRVRSKGSKLVQIIEGDDGVKTTVFVLSSDRKKLTVHHKITADRLPEPMTYRLSYGRK